MTFDTLPVKFRTEISQNVVVNFSKFNLSRSVWYTFGGKPLGRLQVKKEHTSKVGQRFRFSTVPSFCGLITRSGNTIQNMKQNTPADILTCLCAYIRAPDYSTCIRAGYTGATWSSISHFADRSTQRYISSIEFEALLSSVCRQRQLRRI